MNLKQNITSLFKRGGRLFNGGAASLYSGWGGISNHAFADSIFFNLVSLLTDLTHDVTWQFDGSNPGVESAFVRFVNLYGKYALWRVYKDGFVVIKHTQQGEGATAAHAFTIATTHEYHKQQVGEWYEFTSDQPELFEIYVMRSATFVAMGKSDYQLCLPFLTFIDNVLNASNTVSERMGAMVVCSPKNPSNAPMAVTLDDEEKKALEEQLGKEYGALHTQKQVMVLPREMNWQVISLATLDLKAIDKVKMGVAAIADCIKVPANQCALIDSNSSKSLSNGSELREGDMNKYQSYERLLDQTLVQMARDCGLKPVARDNYYTIYNKPTNQTVLK